MAGPADVTSHAPEFQAEPAASQRRPAGLEIPLPSSARSVRAAVAAVVSGVRLLHCPWEFGGRGGG